MPVGGESDARNRALVLDGDFAEGLVNRALACLELNDPGQALRDVDRALDLGRPLPSILAAQAEVPARLGRHDEAERVYTALIQAQILTDADLEALDKAFATFNSTS